MLRGGIQIVPFTQERTQPLKGQPGNWERAAIRARCQTQCLTIVRGGALKLPLCERDFGQLAQRQHGNKQIALSAAEPERFLQPAIRLVRIACISRLEAKAQRHQAV